MKRTLFTLELCLLSCFSIFHNTLAVPLEDDNQNNPSYVPDLQTDFYQEDQAGSSIIASVNPNVDAEKTVQGSDFVDSDKVALREDSGIVAPILWFLWNLAFPKPGDVQTDIPNISPQQKKTPSRDPRNKCPNPEGAFCCVAEGKFREAPFPDPDLNNKNYQFIPGLSPRARVYKDYDDCVFLEKAPQHEYCANPIRCCQALKPKYDIPGFIHGKGISCFEAGT